MVQYWLCLVLVSVRISISIQKLFRKVTLVLLNSKKIEHSEVFLNFKEVLYTHLEEIEMKFLREPKEVQPFCDLYFI